MDGAGLSSQEPKNPALNTETRPVGPREAGSGCQAASSWTEEDTSSSRMEANMEAERALRLAEVIVRKV
jgi:hypothetical protein